MLVVPGVPHVPTPNPPGSTAVQSWYTRVMARYALPLILAVSLQLGCGSDETAHTDYASLTAALEGASLGDTVRVGAARIEGGTVRVPPGVTLVGSGDVSIIVAPADNVAVAALTSPGGPETRVSSVRVESSGRAGVVAVGGGSARIDSVTVQATKGIGIGAEDVATLTMIDVTLTGPVTPENADSQPLDPAPNDTATHGIVLVNVTRADLTRVSSVGFAEFGALLVNSGVTWTEGGADRNLGTGIMSYGGSATLDGLTVCGTLQGLRLIPAYGIVLTNDTLTDTRGLTICDGQGYGALHAGARALHTDLVATGNTNAAVWLQDTDMFEINGSGSRLAGNAFAGVVVVDSTNVTVADATIDGTRSVTRVVGEVGTVQVGDGVQLVRSTASVFLRNLTLVGNERTGILADLNGGSSSDITFDAVSASATGTAYGVLAQGGTITAGWDTGVTRMGAAVTNDETFFASGSMLDIVGVVAPTDIPMAAGIADSGLPILGVVAPTD